MRNFKKSEIDEIKKKWKLQNNIEIKEYVKGWNGAIEAVCSDL